MRLRLYAALAVVVFAPSCTKKAEGQTVAIVNGEEITVPELNAELANANVPAGADKTKVRSQVLQQMIDRTLLEQQARNENIDKSPDFLNRERRLTQELLINMYAQRLSGTAQLPSDQEVEQFETANPQMFAKRETWSLNQVRFQPPSSAPVQEQINNTKTLQDLENVLHANNIGYTPAQVRIDTAVVPGDVYSKVTALPPGEPFIIPVGANAIASVIESRDAQPLVGAQAKSVAIAAIRKQRSANLLENRLKSLRKSAKIDYKPGFAPAS